MDSIETREISTENTHTSNQNGVALGEQNGENMEIKMEIKKSHGRLSQHNNTQQHPQFQYPTGNQLLHRPSHQILQRVPSDQAYIIQHAPNQVFQIQQNDENQQQHQHHYSAFSFPVSSTCNIPASSAHTSNVEYMKMASSNPVGFSQNTIITSSDFTIHTIADESESNTGKGLQKKHNMSEPSLLDYRGQYQNEQSKEPQKVALHQHNVLQKQSNDDRQSTLNQQQEELLMQDTKKESSLEFKKSNIEGSQEVSSNIFDQFMSNSNLSKHTSGKQDIVEHLIQSSTKELQLDKSKDSEGEDESVGNLGDENIESNDSSEEEEDVHQCGRCKQVFNTLKLYMEHKSSKVCKTSKSKSTMPPTKIVTSNVENILSTSVTTSTVDNQNILAAAAKNTIFRDSFISIGTEGAANSTSEKEFESAIQNNNEDVKDVKTLILKLDQTAKRKRGRPPKSSYQIETTPTFNDSTQELDIGNPDSPPKAKRKSRPPRRHKPDEDLITSGTQNQASDSFPDNDFIGDDFTNVTLSSLDPSGLPTVENIHKFFSRGRGRGRGRGRKSHPHHRCPICHLLFPNRLTMLEHRRKHTKQYKCKTCNEGFYTEEKLEKHCTKETHSYPCDQCERIFVNKPTLIRHKLSHSEKIFKCDFCVRSFKTPKDLNSHKLGMHSETFDYVCEVCNKAFSRREKLKRHLMIHAPDRPIFTCPFKNHVGCEKTFYRKDKLTRHLYSHSKVKPFKCEQCDKSFARTDNLREHIRSHTGIFRYYCTVCGKGQPGPKKFVQHMLKQHSVENPQIPKPYEDIAPDTLINQHKAVVEAELAARLARAAASNLKKEKEKNAQKLRKEELETSELHVDQTQGHVTLTMGNLALQAVNGPTLIASPQQGPGGERAELELYSNFQISRHVPENIVRQISENILREGIAIRDNRDNLTRDAITQHEARLQEMPRQQIVESPNVTDVLRRQLEDPGTVTPTGREDQNQQQQQQAIPQALTVEAEGNIPVSTRGIQLIHQGVLPANLQFTALLNSDLVAIGDTVIRNQNGIPMFQQKFGPA